VIGPWDYTERFTYWVRRLAEGGEVLGPGGQGDPIQLIDVRDLAELVIALVDGDTQGTFHAVSPEPPFTFGDMLEEISREVAPAGTTITWVDRTWLLGQGEDGSSIPLWGADDPWISANAASPAAALAAGLGRRPLRRSVRDVLEHALAHPVEDADPAITRDRERELLAAWRAR
jgi:2'-hydroxyisoflavone reductase